MIWVLEVMNSIWSLHLQRRSFRNQGRIFSVQTMKLSWSTHFSIIHRSDGLFAMSSSDLSALSSSLFKSSVRIMWQEFPPLEQKGQRHQQKKSNRKFFFFWSKFLQKKIRNSIFSSSNILSNKREREMENITERQERKKRSNETRWKWWVEHSSFFILHFRSNTSIRMIYSNKRHRVQDNSSNKEKLIFILGLIAVCGILGGLSALVYGNSTVSITSSFRSSNISHSKVWSNQVDLV